MGGQPKDLNSALERIAELEIQLREVMLGVAAVRHPRAMEDRLYAAELELGAIVKTAEQATNAILSAAERIGDRVDQARAGDDKAVEEIADLVIAIYEQCNFQDLTGQRIARVVATVDFVQHHVANLVNLWEPSAFDDVPLPKGQDRREDAVLLHGPQDAAEATSQGAIDALFGQ